MPAKRSRIAFRKQTRLFLQLFHPENMKLVADVADTNVLYFEVGWASSWPSPPKDIVRSYRQGSEHPTDARKRWSASQLFHHNFCKRLWPQDPEEHRIIFRLRKRNRLESPCNPADSFDCRRGKVKVDGLLAIIRGV